MSRFSTFAPVFMGFYFVLVAVLLVYGLHRLWVLYLYWRYHSSKESTPELVFDGTNVPHVTVQLPIYNEKYVVERLINAVCELDYPHDRLEIQVLDDSTDETESLAGSRVGYWRAAGLNIVHCRRGSREGFKAGALQWGLDRAKGDLIAIFDADFVPPNDFLKRTVPYLQDSKVGMVQTRWGHLNENTSLLTRLQAMLLDGHFLLEHTARFKSGAFFNFNGTAGVWRRKAIDDSGGWSSRTLTEDLDLSYRAQLKGWKFIYLPHVVCPAELPVDIFSFRSQQNRWSKGALQVAWRVLGEVWKAPLPISTKLEATAHLTSNIGYILTLMLSLSLLPTLLFRDQIAPVFHYLEAAVFSLSITSIVLFYSVCQRELYKNWISKLWDIPALLALGIGMGLANAEAVFEGIINHSSEFIRTPKYGITGKNRVQKNMSYSSPQRTFLFLQLLFAIYSGGTLLLAIARQNWPVLPFLSLFVFGFSYLTYEAFRYRQKSGPL